MYVFVHIGHWKLATVINHFCHRKPKGEIVFQCDDKVCCTRNAYVIDKNKEAEWHRSRTKEKDDSKESIPKERLCNGEIFFIEDVS